MFVAVKHLAITAALLSAVPVWAASVTQRIPAADGNWDIATVDTATQRLFVGRADGVMMIDLKTEKVTIRFAPGARVHEALVAPGTGRGVSTNGASNTASVWDAATGQVIAELPTGKKPDAAVWDPASKAMWVMNPGDGSATLIDIAKASVAGTMQIGGSLEYAAVDGKGRLYVNVEDKNEIVEIDTRARKVLRHIALAGCDGPTGLDLTPRGVLLASCANGVTKAVLAKSGKMLPDIVTGLRPDAVIVDAKRGRAYVPSGGDGMLTVIDIAGAEPKRLSQLSTQTGARTGAVDPVTGKVYLPAARYAPAADGERPNALPRTFEVLVVAP